MASIPLMESALAELKKELRKDLPDVRSAHLSEALAAALGFRTHAALLAAVPAQADDPAILLLSDESFLRRLCEFGYSHDLEFSFDVLSRCPGLILTFPVSGLSIEYRSARDKAWRNLMVLAINEGIRQKLFSLRPYDNRWPGADPESQGHRGTDWLFDFSLPNGLLAKGYVADAGFGELSIHVAANPKGNGVQAWNSGFDAGDAFASGWLEREKGAWLQSSPDMLSCRKVLLASLASLDATPMGFGDRGRVIM